MQLNEEVKIKKEIGEHLIQKIRNGELNGLKIKEVLESASKWDFTFLKFDPLVVQKVVTELQSEIKKAIDNSWFKSAIYNATMGETVQVLWKKYDVNIYTEKIIQEKLDELERSSVKTINTNKPKNIKTMDIGL